MDSGSEDPQSAEGTLWSASEAPLIDLPRMDEDLSENFNLKFGNDYLLPAKPDEDSDSRPGTSGVASTTDQPVPCASRNVAKLTIRNFLTKPKSTDTCSSNTGVEKTVPLVLKRKAEATVTSENSENPKTVKSIKLESVGSKTAVQKMAPLRSNQVIILPKDYAQSKIVTDNPTLQNQLVRSKSQKKNQVIILPKDKAQSKIVDDNPTIQNELVRNTSRTFSNFRLHPSPSQQDSIDVDEVSELPCPFRKDVGICLITRGIMINHQNLSNLMRTRKDVTVCPLCIQKCNEMKETTYDMLMHIALHKGVQNLHCLCSNCGRYVGRYMEKVSKATNIINKETYQSMWVPKEKDSRWAGVCDCACPTQSVVFDCVLDITCFLNLVLLKMQRQPTLKIEIFQGSTHLKHHLESHNQVCLASSLCEYCREDPRYCHYRLFKGQYVALEEDMCLTSGFHQGSKLGDNLMYCRMVSSCAEDAGSTLRGQFVKQPKMSKDTAKKDNSSTVPPGGTTSTSKPHYSTAATSTATSSVALTSKTNVTSVSNATVRPANAKLMYTLSRPGDADRVPPPTVVAVQPVQSAQAGQSAPRQVIINLTKEQFTEGRYSSAKNKPIKPKEAAQKKKFAASMNYSNLSVLDSLDLSFHKFCVKDAERHLHTSIPRLRCPAYKDGCQFASWHLKLMDAHVKSHLQRVDLLLMFACICGINYHNLFDLFLHLQEKHGNAIKHDGQMSSFICTMDEEDEYGETFKKKPETLRGLLETNEKVDDIVVAKFQSVMWINKLVVASGYIRKMTEAHSQRNTWLESSADLENWIREEKCGMELYTGRFFHMRWEDVPFLDAYLTVPAEDFEDDLDELWAKRDELGGNSCHFNEDDLKREGRVITEEIAKEFKKAKPRNRGEIPLMMHIVSPLVQKRASRIREPSKTYPYSKGITRRPGDLMERHRYVSKTGVSPAGIKVFTLTEHDRHERMRKEMPIKKPLTVRKALALKHYKACDLSENRVHLPKSYTLPTLINRCQYAYVTSVSIGGTTGHSQVKVILKEIDETSYHQCPYCPMSDIDIFAMSRHLSTNHILLQKKLDSDSSNKKNFLMLCRHCDFVTFTVFGCWLHLQQCHRARMWPDLTDFSPHQTLCKPGTWNGHTINCFICKECDRNFTNRRDLISHMKVSRECSGYCQLGYIIVDAIYGEETFPVCMCMFCPEILQNPLHMKWHVFKQHSYTSLLFVCMYCNDFRTVYFTKSLMQSHLLESHAGCVPLWCSVTIVASLDRSTFTTDLDPSTYISNSEVRGHEESDERGFIRNPRAHVGLRLPIGDSIKEEVCKASDSKDLIGVEINSSGEVIQTFVVPFSKDQSLGSGADSYVRKSAPGTVKIESSPDDAASCSNNPSDPIKSEEVAIKDEPADTYESTNPVHVPDFSGDSDEDDINFDSAATLEIKEESVRTLLGDFSEQEENTQSDHLEVHSGVRLEDGEVSLEDVLGSNPIEIKEMKEEDIAETFNASESPTDYANLVTETSKAPKTNNVTNLTTTPPDGDSKDHKAAENATKKEQLTKNAAETEQLTTANEESLEKDLVLVLASDGNEYYVSRDQLNQLMGSS